MRTCTTLSTTLLLVAALVIAGTAFVRGAGPAAIAAPAAQQTSSSSVSAASASEGAPRCETSGGKEIAIICDYTALPVESAQNEGEPRIALNHAALSFKTNRDTWMRLALTFTKLDDAPIPEARTVYLAVDDSGHNFIRRALPHVDLRSLTPGQKAEFSERLLIPVLAPGHYQIELWIPSPDPALKFNASHNFLVSSIGVADKKSGLNRIATFSVVR